MSPSRSTSWAPALATLTLVGLNGCGTAGRFGVVTPGGLLSALNLDSTANTVSIYVEPDAADTPIVNGINNAKSSVQVEVYMMTNTDIENALVAAAHRGVKVQVMLDPTPYNPSNPNSPLTVNNAAMKMLAAGGVQVQPSSPAFKYTHAKTMVVDGQTAYINTFNFTESGFATNREYGAIDADPNDVNDLVNIFNADWNRTNYTPTAPNLVVSPTNSMAKLQALVSGAQKSICIEDEEFSDPSTIALLGQKVKAGLSVEVLLAAPSDVPDNTASAKQLQAEGINVRYLAAPTIHAKLIVADDQAAYIGSVNLSTNSMANNREIGLLMSAPNLVSTLSSTFTADWGNSQAFTSTNAPALPYYGPGNQVAIEE